MPQLYSYIRWSSGRQEKGTTRTRQVAAARTYAAEHNLEMVEIIEPGLSAFRGKNRKGKLGDFIDAVKSGAIPSDSYLYCENLDRLSRDYIDEALKLFLEIIGLGLTIITGMDKKIYNKQSIKENPTDLMLSILMFIRGTEESETKSNRTLGNVKALITRFKDGLPVNIKSIGKHPWWIDESGSQYEAVKKHEHYWPIAREIIDLFMAGNGAYKVKRYLDDKYPKGFVGGNEWDYQMLIRMRKSRALIGERTIVLNKKQSLQDNPDIWANRNTEPETKYVLKGYYPSLCTDEVEFIKLQEVRSKNAYQSKDSTGTVNIKLLSGIGILRCGRCGGTMNSFMNKGKPRYICTNGRHLQKNCTGWSVNAMLIEHCTMIALIIGYMDTDRKTGLDTDVITKQIEVLNDKLIELDKSIANITIAIEKGFQLEQMINKGIELQQKREKLIKDIDRLVQRKAIYENKGSFEIAMFDFIEMIQWNVMIDTSNEIRNKIRSVIDRIIEEVTIDKVDGCISVRIKLIGNDVVFVFAGDNRKPNWKFDVEYYSSSIDNSTESDLDIRNALGTDVLNKIFEQLHTLRGKYLKLLKHVMDEILPVVGYPPIDGKMFWPNTSGNERVVVNYKGERHTVVVKGTLPANVAALIEDSGLKRKEFIEAYRIKNVLNE
ncbi:recombinase family protein [Enterobacter cloacae]|uniref:recombinase family protein n=1 Tax=Enterobacter cloacae TaxID=550 RepID=UPI001A118EFE|nr:recombinase family protein [Enterobacter cloacae]